MPIALLIVDAQYDFMPGGSLAVPGGDEIVRPILKIMNLYDLVVFTQDWHPADHCSFKENGGIWPVHCVQGEQGSAIHEDLFGPEVRKLMDAGKICLVQKGVNKDVDSYSGFWDNERKHKTDLDTILKRHKIDEVHLTGIATDYCVKFTALEAVEAGYKVSLIQDACRGVNVAPGDVDRAVEEMRNKGIETMYSEA
jgi:nicotinamidase/pyrazinamidase